MFPLICLFFVHFIAKYTIKSSQLQVISWVWTVISYYKNRNDNVRDIRRHNNNEGFKKRCKYYTLIYQIKVLIMGQFIFILYYVLSPQLLSWIVVHNRNFFMECQLYLWKCMKTVLQMGVHRLPVNRFARKEILFALFNALFCAS